MTKFSQELIREKWSKEKRILLDGKSYRVGKMSYGDYFLEPGIDGGEREPFNCGTLWLKKIEDGTFVIE